MAATDRILAAVSSRARRGESLRELVQSEIRAIFADADRPVPQGTPHVVLVVGVNGTGKTTTVGKLANLARRRGSSRSSARPTRFAPPPSINCRSGPTAPASR